MERPASVDPKSFMKETKKVSVILGNTCILRVPKGTLHGNQGALGFRVYQLCVPKPHAL